MKFPCKGCPAGASERTPKPIPTPGEFFVEPTAKKLAAQPSQDGDSEEVGGGRGRVLGRGNLLTVTERTFSG